MFTDPRSQPLTVPSTRKSRAKVSVGARVRPKTRDALAVMAEREGRPPSVIIAGLIDDYVARLDENHYQLSTLDAIRQIRRALADQTQAEYIKLMDEVTTGWIGLKKYNAKLEARRRVTHRNQRIGLASRP